MVGRVLTIAGSDSGGGAGIQADLKTFSTFGVYGMSVVTAVTAQNSVGVQGVVDLDPAFVDLQLESVLSDMGVDGVKTGMLHNAEIVRVVSRRLREGRIRCVVVDPVMKAKGGCTLLERRAIQTVAEELVPLAILVMPNIPEAETLSGVRIRSVEEMKEAAQRIQGLGCGAVLVKGGHLRGDAVDVLFDGENVTEFASERIETTSTHGTGCTYSAAVVANLVKGKSLEEAVRLSKRFVTEAIRQGFPLGKGNGPLNHGVRVENTEGG